MQYAPRFRQPCTSVSYLARLVESSVAPRLLLTIYCQPTGRRKMLNVSPLTKCFIYVTPSTDSSTICVKSWVPDVTMPKSNPAMFMPAYLTLVVEVPVSVADVVAVVAAVTCYFAFQTMW